MKHTVVQIYHTEASLLYACDFYSMKDQGTLLDDAEGATE